MTVLLDVRTPLPRSDVLDDCPQVAEPVRAEKTLVEHDSADRNIFAPQIGLCNKVSAYRARQRLNRTFRRNQHEFEAVMDNVAHDPNSQRELQTSWILGR